MAQKFRFVGNHPEDLADGQVLEPGQFVTLNKEQIDDPHNERLIKAGKLVDTGEKSPQKKQATTTAPDTNSGDEDNGGNS